MQRSMMETKRVRRRMEEWKANPPNELTFQLKLHVPEPTHVAHEACSFPFGSPPSSQRNLGYKHILLINFWNNNKLLFSWT
jgi:hypothetical protein